MNPRVVIFDTNFFLGTRSTFRSDAEMRDFLLDLETSFNENGIRPVIPARVLGEIDGFSGAL
ncbi:hypothetical protein GF325_15020, partial [Candidatus Bathyarchaeota archaeon]|nr:hypothetical protein [Candidatus Bathyarchaeota archaeon]